MMIIISYVLSRYVLNFKRSFFKVRNCVLLVWIATAFSDAFPTSYVKFVRNYGNTKGATTDSKSQGSRSPRSYFYSFDSFNPLEEIWSDDIFIPSDDLLHFGFQPTNGHVTPDFSNGLGE